MAVATLNTNTLNPFLRINLAQISEACAAFGVKQLYVFGSITNERFSPQSDIDFLVSFTQSAQNHFFDNYMNLHYRLAEITHRKIDLLTEDSLKTDPNPFFNQSVENAKILIYDEN